MDIGRVDFTQALGLAIDIRRIVRGRFGVATLAPGEHAIGRNLKNFAIGGFGSLGEQVREKRIDLDRALNRNGI